MRDANQFDFNKLVFLDQFTVMYLVDIFKVKFPD